jgi:hypothetical protein
MAELAKLHPEVNACTLSLVLDIARKDNESLDECARKFLRLPIKKQHEQIIRVLL